MPSRSLSKWHGQRAAELNELLHAHAQVGGTGRGRRYLTQQLNHAYAAAICGHFQGYARDLHVECADILARAAGAPLDEPIRLAFGADLGLNRSNPRREVLKADFARFGIADLPGELTALARREDWAASRVARLATLLAWRNAFVHQNLGRITGLPTNLPAARRAREACDQIAQGMDEVLRQRLSALLGGSPW